MRPRDLWELMAEILGACLQASSTESPDDITNEALQTCGALDADEEALIRSTISGVIHFRNVCEGMLKGYCECRRRNCKDKYTMQLIAYLIIFRYTALGGHRLRELFHRSISTFRLLDYLDYITNSKDLMTHSYPHWSEHYDSDFIKDHILRSLEDIAPYLQQDVIKWLNGRTPGGVVAVPELNENEAQMSEVTKVLSKKVEKKEAEGFMRHRKPPTIPPAEVREMIHTIPEKAPAPINYKRALKLPAIRPRSPTKPVEFSFMSRVQKFSPKQEGDDPQPQQRDEGTSENHGPSEQINEAKKSPTSRSLLALRGAASNPPEVRMTNGAIRREANTYMKQMDEQKRILEEMEIGLYNVHEYEEWKRDMRMKDSKERAAELLKRRNEIMQIEENVTRNRRTILETNKVKSKKARADLAQELETQAAEREDALAHQRDEVSQLRSALQRARKKAHSHLKKDRASAAASVRMEIKKIREDVAKEENEKKIARLILIQKIRLLRERNRELRLKLVQDNLDKQRELVREKMCDGMSYAMLKEEMKRLKEESKQLEEERREQFSVTRRRERETIEELKRMCSERRDLLRRTREEDRAGKLAEKSAMELAMSEDAQRKAVEMHAMLKQRRRDKRMEYVTLMREETRRKNELLLLAKDTSAVEEKHWKQQELYVINNVTAKQNRRFQSSTI
ncbi:hypothetical protein ERJ75_001340100 [Trypanosoma vivax]|uniref:Trichohyalin n=1 Tax=Trypanosoma vivax (strain Y486) TaxID=1055687 RepID=G0U675_TRYVY|nr:hypothetical protein ERJ75_001340100 [Trypanosoma vivax]CCC51378.1 conserved hypothetical protein [Trypanosoma vivax Y486]